MSVSDKSSKMRTNNCPIDLTTKFHWDFSLTIEIPQMTDARNV